MSRGITFVKADLDALNKARHDVHAHSVRGLAARSVDETGRPMSKSMIAGILRGQSTSYAKACQIAEAVKRPVEELFVHLDGQRIIPREGLK